MKHLNIKLKNKAETILEILAAITILTIVITSTYSILLRASKTNTTIKNRVIALNIARDGLEGVRSIRDTNWLQYSGDRRDKWLCRDHYINHTNLDNCTGPQAQNSSLSSGFIIQNEDLYNNYLIESGTCEEKITSGYYILDKALNLGDLTTVSSAPSCAAGLSSRGHALKTTGYILEPKVQITATEADLITNREQFRLYKVPNSKPTYDLIGFLFFEVLTHMSEVRSGPAFEPSPFYRRIEIEVVPAFEDLNNPGVALDPNGLCGSGEPCETAKMKVTSFVEWQEDGRWENVKLEMQLFDFYERDSY